MRKVPTPHAQVSLTLLALFSEIHSEGFVGLQPQMPLRTSSVFVPQKLVDSLLSPQESLEATTLRGGLYIEGLDDAGHVQISPRRQCRSPGSLRNGIWHHVPETTGVGAQAVRRLPVEREFFIDNLLVRVQRCFWCTGLAPWEFESPFPGSLSVRSLAQSPTLSPSPSPSPCINLSASHRTLLRRMRKQTPAFAEHPTSLASGEYVNGIGCRQRKLLHKCFTLTGMIIP